MPLFEFTCEACHERSELLVTGEQKPACPKCGGEKLRKEFSTFATQSEGGASGSHSHSHGSGCGCCRGPQVPCGLN
jgi:putative FmdB family regulatory protein